MSSIRPILALSSYNITSKNQQQLKDGMEGEINAEPQSKSAEYIEHARKALRVELLY